MRETEHPAYHTTFRKLCHYHSLLSNFEGPLREDGYDYEGELRWTGEHLTNLGNLIDPPKSQPPDKLKVRSVEKELEPEVFKRMEKVINFLHARVPDHPWLPPQRLYLHLWKESYGEPVRELPPQNFDDDHEPDEPVIAPTIYGVPFAHLEKTRLRLGQMELLHKDFAPLLMFLAGLFYAMGYRERHQTEPQHNFKDGLQEISGTSLADAVDYANEPAIVKLIKAHANEVMPEPHQKLFVAIGRSSRAHSASVFEWVCTHNSYAHMRGLTALLFAMGVRALTDPYARNLIQPWLKTCGKVDEWFSPDHAQLLHEFYDLDFPTQG